MKRLKSAMLLGALGLGLFALQPIQAATHDEVFADMDEPHGTLVGMLDRATEDLYHVSFNAIDDYNLNGSRDVLYMKPGRYQVRTRVEAENFQPSMSRRIEPRAPEDAHMIEIVIEAGKTYHVGAKYDRRTSGYPWHTVLWKVEPSED